MSILNAFKHCQNVGHAISMSQKSLHTLIMLEFSNNRIRIHMVLTFRHCGFDTRTHNYITGYEAALL